MSHQSSRSRGNSIESSSTYKVSLAPSSRGGSRGASRGASRTSLSRSGSRSRKKRNQIPHSHVPINFLLSVDSKNKGYFHEIPNVPRAQPSHGGFGEGERGLKLEMHSERHQGTTSSFDNLSQSSLSYEAQSSGLAGVSLTSDPILNSSLSRIERERLASEVLMGQRTLLPLRSNNTSHNGWGVPLQPRPLSNPGTFSHTPNLFGRHNVGEALTQNLPKMGGIEWGSRPSTTNNSHADKIVTSPFDPRYPGEDAPVASTDFMNVVGQSDTLPYSFETQAEASLSNKIRLLNKHVEEKSSVATMEEIMMRKESKGMAAQRLRKARLAADKKAKEKNLEITRLDKLKMKEKIVAERKSLHDAMCQSYSSKKANRLILKQLSSALKKQMGLKRKVSTGFAQCLRTSASSGMLNEGVTSPETTYGVTKSTEFDINNLIIGGDDVGGARSDVRGYGGNSLESDINGEDDEKSIDSGLHVSQDSLIDYTASIHSNGTQSIYSTLSPGGGGYNEGVDFRVKKPEVKKMGSGFLVKVKKGKVPKIDKRNKGFQAILYNKGTVLA